MTANELKKLYIEYFKTKDHTEIENSSLIPNNDPSVLFTTAGMHPLVPYLLGEKHPSGERLTNIQRCLRTGDIDEVGDDTHLTFFEMLGNWSLGDYFKEQTIELTYDFLVNKLKFNPNKITVTVFAGDDNVPKDEEAYNHWKNIGISEDRIFYLNKKHNWWGPAGTTGPCGPDTEIFIDTDKEKCSDDCNPSCDCGKYIEIWNNVFMEYNKNSDGSFSPLKQKNVDTGVGFERVLSLSNGKLSVYDNELFENIIKKLEELSGKKYDEEKYQKSFRIIVDHIRTATFVLGDERSIVPSNTDQGYVLRRIIRRTIRHLKNIGITESVLSELAMVIINDYSQWYNILKEKQQFILLELEKEEKLFNKTIVQGIREFNKELDKLNDNIISGETAFKLFDTFGFPLEFTIEMANERNKRVDIDGYQRCYLEHQEKSRKGAEQKFKGGLSDNNAETTRLHTTTHILHECLRRVLGENVFQKGSNINAERLRFDFSFDRKMTEEEIQAVENMVNLVISSNLDIKCEEMTLEDAQSQGAIGLFDSKYGNRVKVYSVGDFSKEICGGPHVRNTGELGYFKILKEESCAAGIRRIKAFLIELERINENETEYSHQRDTNKKKM